MCGKDANLSVLGKLIESTLVQVQQNRERGKEKRRERGVIFETDVSALDFFTYVTTGQFGEGRHNLHCT